MPAFDWPAIIGINLLLAYFFFAIRSRFHGGWRVEVAVVIAAAGVTAAIGWMILNSPDEPACEAFGDCSYTELKR